MRVLTGALVLIWTGLCVWMGPPTGDFANYYTAAHTWWTGGDVAQLYDYAVFRELARPLFGETPVGFATLTPPSALVAVPLLPLGPQGAAGAWWGAQWMLGLVVAGLIAALIRQPWWVGLAGLVAFWPALQSHLANGQMHLPVVAVVAAGLLAWRGGRDLHAGVLWALAVGLKVHAWPLIVLAAVVGRWTVVGSAVATLLLGTGVSVGLLGWPIHAVFFTEIAPAASSGMYVDPWHPALQSLHQLGRHLFLPHPGLNPDAVASVPMLVRMLPATALMALVGPTLVRAASWTDLDDEQRQRVLGAASFAALVGGSLLSRYHLLLVWPGLALGVEALWRSDRRRAGLVALLAVAAVWVPSPTTWSPGWLALLDVPRLWLLVAAWGALMPWQPAWSPRGIGVAVATWAVLVGLSPGPTSPPAGQRVDGPGFPLILTDLVEEDGRIYFQGLTHGRWQALAWDPATGQLETASPRGPGRRAVTDDQGRTWFLSDHGVGIGADRLWVTGPD